VIEVDGVGRYGMIGVLKRKRQEKIELGRAIS